MPAATADALEVTAEQGADPTPHATDWRDSISETPPDDENVEVLESRFGKNWREILDMPEEEDLADTTTTPENDAPASEVGTQDPAAGTDAALAAETTAATGEIEPAAVLDAEIKQLADLGKQWRDAFVSDPKGALAALLNSPAFTHEDKVALFQQVTQTEQAKQVEIDPAKYQPASEFEQALLPSLDWMRAGESKVAEALAVRDRDIQHTYVEAQTLNAKLDAVCQFLGLELPKHDIAAIFKHYDSSPEGTLQDAVTKVYREGAIKAATVEKQKRAPRPETLRNLAPTQGAKVNAKNMVDLWDVAGEQLGLID